MTNIDTFNKAKLQYQCATLSRTMKNERNDCAIVAISTICNVNYDQVHELFKIRGRRNRCGSHKIWLYDVISALHLADVVKSYKGIAVKSKTLKTLQSELTSGRYIVIVAGHALPMVDGCILDWTAGSKRRVKEVIKVEL